MVSIVKAYALRLVHTKSGRRLLMLKFVVGAGLVFNHFNPGQFGLFTNLIWLFAF